MKIKYTINHFDFVKEILPSKFKYIAQSKNGTWTAFTYKPIASNELQCWIPNPEITSNTTEYILYNPFDGYPQNQNWKQELYTSQKYHSKLSNSEWNKITSVNNFSLLKGCYILFCDGSFGVIIQLQDGQFAIKSFSNTYQTVLGEKFDYILLGRNNKFNEAGTLYSRRYADVWAASRSAGSEQIVTYYNNKFKIARIFDPKAVQFQNESIKQIQNPEVDIPTTEHLEIMMQPLI